MDDLSAMISQFMQNPDSVRQMQDMARSLGLMGDEGGSTQPEPPPAPPQPQSMPNLDFASLSQILGSLKTPAQPPPPPTPQPDLSALAGLFSRMNQPSQPSQPQASGGMDLSGLASLLGGGMSSGGAPDFSALSGLLGGMGAAQSPPPSASSVSALTNMLGGSSSSGGAGGAFPGGFDMGILMKIQQAMSTLNAGQENIKLLLALKSHLKTDRAQKVDDAIKVMQLVQFLPLIKESGLFGNVDDILGKLNLGSLLGGGNTPTGGNVLGNLLSGLGLGGKR